MSQVSFAACDEAESAPFRLCRAVIMRRRAFYVSVVRDSLENTCFILYATGREWYPASRFRMVIQHDDLNVNASQDGEVLTCRPSLDARWRRVQMRLVAFFQPLGIRHNGLEEK